MAMFAPQFEPHITTTKRLPGIYPFMASTNLGVCGPYMGDDLFTRMRHYFEPNELLRQDKIKNLNIINLGDINNGKSALNKVFCWRLWLLYHWSSLILDRKGEYELLALAMGVSTFRFKKNNELTINPLDMNMMTIDEQLDLLKTFGRILHTRADGSGTLNDPLSSFEINALNAALVQAHLKNPEGAEIKHLIASMKTPYRNFLLDMEMTQADYITAIRPLLHGFRRLVEGDLQGMFDGPTSKRFNFKDMPAIIFRLDGVTGDARRLLLACATYWTQGGWAREKPIIDIKVHVNDEGYEDFTDPDYIGTLNRSWKLGRQYGVINILTLHHQTQFLTGVNAEVTADLIENTATVISHRQSPGMLLKTRDALGFNDAQADIIPTLDVGDALWRVGTRYAYFQHLQFLDQFEEDFCFTNQAAERNRTGIAEISDDISPELEDRIGTKGERIRRVVEEERERALNS